MGIFSLLPLISFFNSLTSIASVTGFHFGLNVLVELIVGYAIPNSGIALITLKPMDIILIVKQAIILLIKNWLIMRKSTTSNFKGQLLSTLLNIIISLSVANWQLNNVENICDPHQKDNFKCPGANTYFYSSIQYGEIGPAKFWRIISNFKMVFPFGVLLVFPCVWLKKMVQQKYSNVIFNQQL